MTLLDALMRETETSAKFRGHAGTWEIFDSEHGRYTCALCGMDADANVRPMPNEIDVGGPAVALDCTGSEQRVENYPGPFSVGPRKVYGALCEDGKQRTATCSANGPDTFFSIPARVSAYGRTVSGFVTNDDGIWRFIAYRYGRNANVLKRVTEKKEEAEQRQKAVCGRCGGRTYVTEPLGADLACEGVRIEPCPRCTNERGEQMHGDKLHSQSCRATMLAYFDRLVAEGMDRGAAFVRVSERFDIRSNRVLAIVLERDEQRKAVAA